MKTLKGQHIYLRALEPEDLEFVYQLENDESVWEISQTQTPYSRFLIRQYLDNAQQDIYEAKQLRLAICKNDSFQAIGLIDLFDFDPKNKRAGIGILIQNEENRLKGFSRQALELLIHFAFERLEVHQLYANIATTNEASIALFTTFGFECVGIKKEWNFQNGIYSDEALYQLIRKS
ncbi:GNAT family N-acetyltransferase [Flavobacterium filum]|uniref:GNAT family N-acetyltransferase n=1 Tax=Flavobacterium filum TaxID=370974 RepID=UPI000410C85A|nr:GNAT family protein [Flavobacterium filum]